VAHFVIDGVIRNPGRSEPADAPDSMLDPDAIARTYLHLLQQDRSAWAWEVELRPGRALLSPEIGCGSSIFWLLAESLLDWSRDCV